MTKKETYKVPPEVFWKSMAKTIVNFPDEFRAESRKVGYSEEEIAEIIDKAAKGEDFRIEPSSKRANRRKKLRLDILHVLAKPRPSNTRGAMSPPAIAAMLDGVSAANVRGRLDELKDAGLVRQDNIHLADWFITEAGREGIGQ